MANYLEPLFTEPEIIEKIKTKLPVLFQLAEIDSSRAGKIGMEIGSVRERIIVALLMYKFGEENINTDIPITEPETDVKLYSNPISIKTISGNLGGVKLIWTVDPQKAFEFSNNYFPSVDMLLAQIKWGGVGALYYFPVTSQVKVFNQIKRENYIKLPKQGTNPRGVEVTQKALEKLTEEKNTKMIGISWKRGEANHGIYDRWIELWEN